MGKMIKHLQKVYKFSKYFQPSTEADTILRYY